MRHITAESSSTTYGRGSPWHGVPAYVVTFDGEHAEWLEHHQPTISLETARAWKEAGLPLRFMTSWLGADAFIDLSDRLYFYDAESVYTFGLHRQTLPQLAPPEAGGDRHALTHAAGTTFRLPRS